MSVNDGDIDFDMQVELWNADSILLENIHKIHSFITKFVELQSSNSTFVYELDFSEIQKIINDFIDEISVIFKDQK